MELPRLRLHFNNAEHGRIVNKDLRLRQNAGGLHHLALLRLRLLAKPQPVRIHTRLAGEKALHDLLVRHFNAEHRHARLLIHCGVAGNTQREAGLAEAGARGENDHIGAPQPAEAIVERLIAGEQHIAFKGFDLGLFKILVEQILYGDEFLRALAVAQVHQNIFRLRNGFVDVRPRPVADRLDLGRRADQMAHHR